MESDPDPRFPARSGRGHAVELGTRHGPGRDVRPTILSERICEWMRYAASTAAEAQLRRKIPQISSLVVNSASPRKRSVESAR